MVLAGAAAGYGGDRRRPVTGGTVRGSRRASALLLVPGDHGSTFAGQPLACAAALATLDVLENERLMESVDRRLAAAPARVAAN